MAKWGSCDFRQLKDLQKKMERFEKHDADAFMKKAINNLAQRLLRRVIKLTPTVSSKLKKSWKVSEIVEVGGNCYEIEIFNAVKYAMYVEYGHRQQPGRFIPGYWNGNQFIYDEDSNTGMVLKASWVNGVHMLEKASQSVDTQKEKIIEKMLEKELRKLFDD